LGIYAAKVTVGFIFNVKQESIGIASPRPTPRERAIIWLVVSPGGVRLSVVDVESSGEDIAAAVTPSYLMMWSRILEALATPRGFEPLISTVTGWHVRPLHHGADYPLTGLPACLMIPRENISSQQAIQDRVAFVDESLPLP
jgi:hypothetical protein